MNVNNNNNNNNNNNSYYYELWNILFSLYLTERCSVDLNISKEQISNNENDFGGYVVVQFFPLVQFFLNWYRIH